MEKEVILYSGGMDSLILGKMFPKALKLYVDTRSPYADKEIQSLPQGVTICKGMLNLSWIERADSIVPARNAYLALVAANYGDHIMLGATEGDASTDKDDTWASFTEQQIRYMYSGKHFQPHRDIRILLPIKNKNKSELVRWYLDNGHDKYELIRSISCYSSEHEQCGVCKSCTRKWLALVDNEIYSEEWVKEPWEADWSGVVRALKSTGYWRSEGEDAYAKRILREYGIYL